MALPIVGYVAATIGAGIVSRLTNPVLDTAFNVAPTTRTSTYEQNFDLPNCLPSVDHAIQMYHAGYLGEPQSDRAKATLRALVQPQGIDMFNPNATQGVPVAWDRLALHLRQKPGVANIVSFWHHGLISRNEALDRMKEQGFSNAQERELMLKLETPLSLDMVMTLFHTGKLQGADLIAKLKALGYISEDVRALITGVKPVWSLPDIRTLNLRGDIADDEVPEYLKRAGYFTIDDEFLFNRLKPFVPPPSDLIRFAVKDIFDPNLPDRAGMLQEYAEQTELKDWFKLQGIGSYSFVNPAGVRITQDVGEMYWLASFELPSPTQAYEMLHRLRPNRVQRYKVGEVGGNPVFPAPVELPDVRALLKDKDYRPGWRDRLAAISYRAVQRNDVKRLYNDGVYGQVNGKAGWNRRADGSYDPIGPAERELFEVFQDFGYNAYDAGQLGYWTSLEQDRKKGGKVKARVVSLLCKSYQLGAIDRATLLQRLRNAGLSIDDANSHADTCDLEYNVGVLTKSIAAIRLAFLTGRLDVNEARRELNRQDIEPGTVARLIRLWQVEILGRRKEVTAGQLCEWVGSGLITMEEMSRRLGRLGWNATDVQRIVRHCVLGHQAKEAKELAKRARAEAKERERIERELIRLREKRQREADRQESMLRRAAEKALQRMREGREPGKIKRYYRRGLISIPEIRSALLDRGWSVADTDRWILTELTYG